MSGPTSSHNSSGKHAFSQTVTEGQTAKQNSSEQIWKKICDSLQALIEPHEFRSWIAPIKVSQRSDHELLLLIPNMVFYQGILERYLDKLELTKAKLGLNHLLLSIEVDEVPTAEDLAQQDEFLLKSASSPFDPEPLDEAKTANVSFNGIEPSATQQSQLSQSLQERSANLNPGYTFESFVRGDSNQFAHATCSAVAESPGQTYNPLFVYGSTGLGKTHLLQAVGHRILRTYPAHLITYISSERFMNEMIYCLRFNKMWDFRRKYRNCDVFLVDDIQFISGKERTQEEFFHTFNALYEAKKQIVITSDMFPQDIPDIEDRLRNRFQWGLIADIQPPSVEHRIAILNNKAQSLGINLNHDVALYIANHAKRNVRELEGALHRIAAFAALQGRRIDLPLALETFQNVLGDAPKRLTIETIQKTVAEHFKLRVVDLKSKKRQRALTVPRQIAMYLSRTKTNASFPEIGARFGGKDHTTIMHAVKKVESDRQTDLDLKSSIEALERKIEQFC